MTYKKFHEAFGLYSEYLHTHKDQPKERTVFKGWNIGKWVAEKRYQFTQDNLPKMQQEMLEKAGLDFSLRHNKKKATIKEVKQFISDHGTPPKYRTHIGTFYSKNKHLFEES